VAKGTFNWRQARFLDLVILVVFRFYTLMMKSERIADQKSWHFLTQNY
jgi:hypothetical protein